ncbi:MAG: ATP-binding cassette domain-containing protein [Treponema sp.]|nr:ATP-binding cassette domain-containing protein [Treponema sp.]MCL2272144.1 ATP-binding cassette domain-containing protein [Treponema sp.]
MAGIIELKNVSFTTQEGVIISDASVEFEESKTTAIVGPSGCGKSTMLKLAAGLLVPSQGEVNYKGKNISQMNRQENLQFRSKSAFVFQDSALWANQNLFQILELPLRIHFPGMSKEERFEKILNVAETVGYFKDLYIRPARLSMGEQKLIAFARAIICNPSLFFLDEWTESLDDNTAEWLIRVIRAKKKEGSTVLFVSHDIRLIMELADYVVVVTDGKMSVKAAKDHVLGDLLLNDSFTIGIAS